MTTYIYKRQSELPESLDDLCGEVRIHTEPKIAISNSQRVINLVAGTIFLFSAPITGYMAYVNKDHNPDYLMVIASFSTIDIMGLGLSLLLSARNGYYVRGNSFTAELSGLLCDHYNQYKKIFQKNDDNETIVSKSSHKN